MGWLAWTSIGFAVAAVICFLRGAFEISFDALPWGFFFVIFATAAACFGAAALLT